MRHSPPGAGVFVQKFHPDVHNKRLINSLACPKDDDEGTLRLANGLTHLTACFALHRRKHALREEGSPTVKCEERTYYLRATCAQEARAY